LQDYESCRRAFRTSFDPQNFAEEMLCDDAAENWWRRERVRRFEAARIRNAIVELECRPEVDGPQRLTELTSKFVRLLREKETLRVQQNVRSGMRRIEDIDTDIAAVREQLHKTVDGVRYIQGLVGDLKREAELRGQLSESSERLLYACIGEGDELAQSTVAVSRLRKQEISQGERIAGSDANKSEETRAAEQSIEEDFRKSNWQVLILGLEAINSSLKLRRSILEGLNVAKKQVERGEAAMHISEKLSHAETRYDRRLYKAYATLYTIKFQQARLALAIDSAPQLPEM